MKNCIAAILMILAAGAQAQSLEGALTKVELDGSFPQVQMKGSKLKVDLSAHVVSLELNTGSGKATSIVLPIVKSEPNGCGALRITAERNSFDGSHQSLVVIDHSAAHCEEDKHMAPVEIELQATSLGNSARAFFEAHSLRIPQN